MSMRTSSFMLRTMMMLSSVTWRVSKASSSRIVRPELGMNTVKFLGASTSPRSKFRTDSWSPTTISAS
uniref:Putative secreted protein n=1 Tax=Ixodes ricinus TaxID=34613 RepID=A0A6B0U878_IXORI